MKIELTPGERISVTFKEADGEIVVEFNEDNISVHADMADTSGRQGEIYREEFGELPFCITALDGTIVDLPHDHGT